MQVLCGDLARQKKRDRLDACPPFTRSLQQTDQFVIPPEALL